MTLATERLAASRAAIAAALRGPGEGHHPSDTPHETHHGDPADRNAHPGALYGLAAWLRSRWQDHPAHLVVEIAGPLVRRWVARKPLTYAGLAACLGAGLVLWRPWRLVSATGLLLAVLRSTRLPGFALNWLRHRSLQTGRTPSEFPQPSRRNPP